MGRTWIGHITKPVLVVDGDQRHVIMVGQVSGHGFKIGNYAVGLKLLEDFFAQHLKSFMASGQSLQIIGKRFDPGHPVIEAGKEGSDGHLRFKAFSKAGFSMTWHHAKQLWQRPALPL